MRTRLSAVLLAAIATTMGAGVLDPTRAALAAAAKPGAVALGTTNYPIPAGAVFVATTGSDSASGTQSAPLRTIHQAVAVATNGGTIVIRGGTYRESITISGERLTLQPYPHEAVIVRGSAVVTGWVKTGTMWRKDGWGYQFARQQPIMVLPAHPMANAPDMTYYDGARLNQVSKQTQVKNKTFYVDYATSKLYIGVDPAGHTVEGATQSVGLSLVGADNSVIRGLQFDHFATPINTHGAVIDQSDHVTFDNDIFVDNAAAGLSLTRSTNTVITNSTFDSNGQLGLHAYQAVGARISNSRIVKNNIEHFDQTVEAGGAKFSDITNATFDGNLFDNNSGNALWFDVGSVGATVTRNEVYSNSGNGIEFEISTTAIIAANRSWQNAGGGIRIIESGDVDIYNNVLFKNDTALEVWEGSRAQNVSDVVIRNNVLMDGHASTGMLLDVDDKTNTKSAVEMGTSVNADAYCRSVANTPSRVANWAQSGGGEAAYATVSQFRASEQQEASGLTCEGTDASGMFVKPSTGNFALGTSSIGRGAGVPLPANVAAALSVAAGVPVDLGVI